MNGNNSLILNEATIIEAMQEYLDKRYTPNISVKSVRQDMTQGGNINTFRIELTDKLLPSMTPTS
jgi:hypothetical protein